MDPACDPTCLVGSVSKSARRRSDSCHSHIRGPEALLDPARTPMCEHRRAAPSRGRPIVTSLSTSKCSNVMVVAMVHGAMAHGAQVVVVVAVVVVVVVAVVVNGLRLTQRRAGIPNISALAYRNGNQSHSAFD